MVVQAMKKLLMPLLVLLTIGAFAMAEDAEGIIDEAGRYVIPPEYSIWEGAIGPDGALARVWFDEAWTAAGYINRAGEVVCSWRISDSD